MQVVEVLRSMPDPSANLVSVIHFEQMSSLEHHALARVIASLPYKDRQTPFVAELLCQLSLHLMRPGCDTRDSGWLLMEVGTAEFVGTGLTSLVMHVDGLGYKINATSEALILLCLKVGCMYLSCFQLL